jgi:transcriptional regulator of acetoin/glycerol metabolism
MPDSLGHTKKALVEALEKSLGVVSTACKAAGISRDTHYRWLKEDPEYKAQVEELSEVAVDFAESHLHKLIRDGNPAATIFFLKTKGKNRGYVERQEIAVAEKKPLSWFTAENADVS